MPSQVRQLHTVYHTILSGAYASVSPIDLREIVPVSLIIPSAWTAAAISFSGSPDGINYGWLASESAKIIRLLPVNALNQCHLSPGWFDGINWLFIVSGDLTFGTGGLVNQGADRQLILNCRDRFGTSTP
jgi:hypothetical protein